MQRLLCILILLLAAGRVHAVPESVNRILRSIDFEERRFHTEDLPMHWTKVEGPQLPHYVNGALSTDNARSGRYSFKLSLNGGGLIYRYDSGQIPVHRGAHYRVETHVQTTVLPHARARLTAYFTDLDHRPILSSVVHSELYAARTEGEGWKHLALELSTIDEHAAYLVMEVALLQPEHYRPTSLGDRALFPQDIHGSAWFDDVRVSQVPKVMLQSNRPGNIFRAGEIPRLQVQINDRFTDDLAAQLVIRDAADRVIYQRSGALDMNTATQTGPGEYLLDIVLPELRPGWYRTSLHMTSHGDNVGDHVIDLVQLADARSVTRPDERFGIVATDLPFDGWDELPELLPYLAAGRVKLGLWRKDGDIQQSDPKGFSRLLERFRELNITATACLMDLPPQIARHLPDGTWNTLLKVPDDLWQPQLAHLVSRHASLESWQLGADGSDAFVTQPEMRRVYERFYREFAELIQSPDLAMPWPAWYELEGRMPATVALSVPSSVLPSQIPLYMQDASGAHGKQPRVALTLQLLDRDQYGRELQIRDFTQRVIYALAAGARRIDLPLPLTIRTENGHVVKQPQELLLVLRTLTHTLGGATFKGKVPIAENVEAFLFDRDGQGILAIWNIGHEAGLKQLQVNLGSNPARLDLWGNLVPLIKPRSDDGADIVEVPLDGMPIFLLDIDANIAQMRASVALDRPLLESSFKPHLRKLRFTNPYKQAISGTLKLRPQQGWTVSPPTFAFSLNPGETFERDLTIELPYNSLAGAKTIEAQFAVQADRNTAFNVPIRINLGLSDVGMQTLALRDGKDIIVQQMITNYGDKPIDYAAFTMYPGQARQERLVTNLEPGKTTIKRYRFTDVKFKEGATVRSGLKETYGSRILNDEVPIQ